MFSLRTKRLILLAFPADFAIPTLSRKSEIKSVLKAHAGLEAKMQSAEPSDELRFFCIEPKEVLRVGWMTVSRIEDTGIRELGIYIYAPHRCKGFATESMQAVIDWLRQDVGTKAIVSETFSDCEGSIKVMQKVGMNQIEANLGAAVVRYGVIRPGSEVDLVEPGVLTLKEFVYPKNHVFKRTLRWQLSHDPEVIPAVIFALLAITAPESGWRVTGVIGFLVCAGVFVRTTVFHKDEANPETLIQFRDKGLFRADRLGTGALYPWPSFTEFRNASGGGLELWNGATWYWIPPQAFTTETLDEAKQLLLGKGLSET